MSIVACTGLFKSDWGLPWYWRNLGVADLVDFMSSEAIDGVGETGIRCGAIKVATKGDTISPEEDRVLRAAGEVSHKYDLPIITHTDPDGWHQCNVGLQQLDLLVEAGASPERVAIGHVCGTANLQYLFELCERGSFIAFDRIGHTNIQRDDVRAATIVGLVGAGFARRVLLSHDHQLVWRSRYIPKGANTNLPDAIFRNFIPLLGQYGVTEGVIEDMLRANPVALLGSNTA
jgi:phosphotriesterase-related protein